MPDRKPASQITALLFIAAMLTILISACGSNQNAVTPDTPLNPDRTPVGAEMATGHNLWGYWNCCIPPTLDTIEFLPARSGEFHLNTRRFLEDTICKDCLTLLSLEKDYSDMVMTAEVRITHPFAGNPKFTGFDVRGIVISNGSLYFPLLDARVPDASQGDFALLNPDGWTRLWNTKEFAPGSAPFPILEYSKGKFAAPGGFTGTVNPYVEFAQEPRSCFPSGASITRELKLTLIPGGAIFGYAVDASWEPPTVDPPVDLKTDFPESANALEPWLVTVWQSEPLKDQAGDTATEIVRMIERQDEGLPEYTYMECPLLWDGVIQSMLWIEWPNEPFWYPLTSFFPIVNETGAPEGSYPAMVLVKDGFTDANLGDINHRYELAYVQVQHYVLPPFTGKAVYLAPEPVDPGSDGVPNMFLLDMVTMEETQVTDYTTFENYIEEPRINAQGSRMLLTVYGDTMQMDGSLEVHDVSGPGSWVITPPDGVLGTADFHPDGDHIVVAAGVSFENLTDLVAVKYDGTGWTKIATAPGTVRFPRCSPDGTRIAMVITIMDPYNYETGLWIYDVDTSQFTKLVGGQYNIECPSWSPVKIGGADSIVYQTDQNDPGGFFVDLYTINPDTLEGGLLIDDDAPMDKHPSYSPDGLSVMYTRFSQSLTPGVWVYMTGTKQTYQITKDGSLANSPCWSWDW